MTKKERRQAQLDAVRILELYNAGLAGEEEAYSMAIPMVHSKPTEYTRARRRRARIEVEKAIAAQLYADELAELIKIRPKRKKKTELQKKKDALKRITGRKTTTPEQNKALRAGYTAKQVAREKASEGSRAYKSRKTRLFNRYEIPEAHTGQILKDLEYMTPAEIAKKYDLLEKREIIKGVSWCTYTKTDVADIPITWEMLVRGFGDVIRRNEIEDKTPNHKRGYLIYDNDLFSEWVSLNEFVSKGHYRTLADAINSVLNAVFGEEYIYIPFDDVNVNNGVVLLAQEWFRSEPAKDWKTTMRYKKIYVDESEGF